ncbi:MAG: IS4 family transposase, partial [Candidatus Electrothrix sp. AUS1_2]|nr:IS4 family transposase [Candidatus Electrothrix sp. AUS1_2]
MKLLVLKQEITSRTYDEFCFPPRAVPSRIPILKSRGDRPLQMTFGHQLNALIRFRLQEHDSARHLVSDLNGNNFAKEFIAPVGGISRSSFSEAVNTGGSEQFQYVLQEVPKQARAALPVDFQHFEDIVAVDGSLIDTVLSMHRADYRKKSRKAKGHFGFDINRGVPTEFRLTEGKAGERPFVDQILSAGRTGVTDRGCQSHILFDSLQKTGKNFVRRIKACAIKSIIKENCVKPGGNVFQDSSAHLGTAKNRTGLPVRVIGYPVEGVKYYVATNRFDPTAEQVAEIYKLRSVQWF